MLEPKAPPPLLLPPKGLVVVELFPKAPLLLVEPNAPASLGSEWNAYCTRLLDSPVLEVLLLAPKPPKVEVELLLDPKENAPPPPPPPNAMAAGMEARRRAMAGGYGSYTVCESAKELSKQKKMCLRSSRPR